MSSPMTDSTSPAQQLASVALGMPVRQWIAALRDDGHSWRGIADILAATTGIRVSHETVRVWGTTTKPDAA